MESDRNGENDDGPSKDMIPGEEEEDADKTTEGANNTIDGAENTLEGTENTVEGAENTVEGAENTVEGAENTVEGTENTVEGAENTVDGAENTVEGAGNTTDDAGNTTDGAENTLEGAENTTDAIENTTDVDGNTTDVIGNTTDDVDNTTDAIENATDVAGNTTDVAGNTTDDVDNTTDGGGGGGESATDGADNIPKIAEFTPEGIDIKQEAQDDREKSPTLDTIADQFINAILDEVTGDKIERPAPSRASKQSECEGSSIVTSDDDVKTELSNEDFKVIPGERPIYSEEDEISERNKRRKKIRRGSTHSILSEGCDSDMENEELAERLSKYEDTIAVKVTMLPNKRKVILICEANSTIDFIKQKFWKRMQIEPHILKFTHNGNFVPSGTPLKDLGAVAGSILKLIVESRDPSHFPLGMFKRFSYQQKFINVLIRNSATGATSTVPIEVLAPTRKKPYLGGFRHKITSVEFHNASSQTQQLPLRWPKNTLYCRDTQTKMLANQMIQTAQDTATQMTKIGCYVSVQGNKLRKPGKYRTADEEEAEKKTMVLVLQKYIRRYLAIKRVGKIRAAKERKLQFERDQQLKREQDKEKRIRDEFQRRQFPRSRKDFNTLFNALEKWRLQEIAKINDTLTGAERKAALYMLLNQELEHLAAIGRHQAIADDIVAEKNIQAFLNKTSDPKVFISKYDNSATLIDTPYTVRASQLREIYNSLLENHYTLDERLDALLTLKYTIRDYDCKLCYDITRLVDREADLLMRGVSNNNLAGLRKRISTLFLQFIKTPFFNPEAARYTTLPPLAKSNKVYYCASCSKFHPSHEFPLNVNAARPGACKMCISKDNEGRFRADYNNFKYMLRSLREKEERYKDNSTIAFLIQDSDIHYLVTKIWGSESIISNCTDLYDLTLVRWNKDTVWTPWNCLLVTHEEAVCHDKLEDIYEAYGEVFVNKVNHKHMMAKSHFGRLPWLETKVLNPNEDKYYPSKKGSKYEPKQTSCHIFPTG